MNRFMMEKSEIILSLIHIYKEADVGGGETGDANGDADGEDGQGGLTPGVDRREAGRGVQILQENDNRLSDNGSYRGGAWGVELVVIHIGKRY